MKKSLFTLVLSLCFGWHLAMAEVHKGTCGENLTWSFDTESGALVIEGSGEMENYFWETPWNIFDSPVKSVSLPNGLTTIGDNAFGNNRWFTEMQFASIEIPEGVAIIGQSAFAGNTSLTTVKFSEGLKSIGANAFSDCSNLSDVSFPCSLTEIDYNAFYGCSSLTTVTFAEGLNSIGSSAFSKCSALTKISLPETLTSIGDNAFGYCTQLTEVKIPNSIHEVGSNIFPDLGFPILNDHILFRYPKEYSSYEYQIPDGIHTIAGGAFQSCKVKSVIIPQTVTKIGDYAFYDSDLNSSINLPNGLKSIGNYAFARTQINRIVIPDGVTEIGKYAFWECDRMSEVTLPKYLKKIEESTFEWCSCLCSIVLPSELTSIGDNAFRHCGDLTVIDLPKTLVVIGNSAFDDCDIATIVVPENVASIGKSAFANMGSLVSIEVLQGNTHYCTKSNVLYTIGIDTLMTYPCKKSDKSFEVPATVEVIDEYAFANNEYIETVSLPDGLKFIGKGAFRNSTLTSVTIPEGITELNAQTFCECKFLASVTLPSTLKSINGDANFFECAFKSIVLPASLEYIGPLSFYSCDLETVISYATIAPSLGYDVFSGISPNATLYYPDGSDYSSWLPYFANTASGIKEKTVGCNHSALPLDIYDLNGRIVKQNTTTLERLPRGLYIIGGKKLIKR